MIKDNTIAGIVLAAGKGTRFKSTSINKVTLPLAGKPIILYGVELLEKLRIKPIIVVVGFALDSVKLTLKDHAIVFANQQEQKGTADALSSVLQHVSSSVKHFLVINGDDPFHKGENIKRLMQLHETTHGAVTFITSKLSDPTGMGRVIRDSQGKVIAIVEEKDATESEKAIKEVNAACYIFTKKFLNKYLGKLEKSSVTGELYITDLIALAIDNNEQVITVDAGGSVFKAINTPDDLKEAELLLNKS